jgi:allantoate deiminase
MVGSHIDSVVKGGAFDGVAGVIAALEAFRTMQENNIETRHSLELVIFMEEEGSRFGRALMGSSFLCGKFGIDDLDKFRDSNGITLKEANVALGLDVDRPIKRLQPDEVKAMLELHVEQSVVLDNQGIPLGIIEGIAGVRWLEVTLRGVADHAGATPMSFRQDALRGAATVIAAIPSIINSSGSPHTVSTVGKLECNPNVTNVIPGEVKFTIDIRDIDKEGIEKVTSKVKEFVKKVAKDNGLNHEISIKGDNAPVYLSKKVLNVIEEEAQKADFQYLKMISGAAHDSMVLSELTDVGMIFVPSINGRSHCPEEKTNYRDIKLGADLLLYSLLRLAERIV